MNTQNDKADRTDSVEELGSEATCAPGCDCNTSGSGGRGRWIVGVVVLLVAGGLVARAMIKDNGTKTENDEATFAVIADTEGAGEDVTPVPVAVEADNKVVATIAGKEIATLADLNRLAVDTDAVFVYLPGPDASATTDAPTSQLEAAVKTIKAQGVSVGIFTLKTDAPEYTQLASQMAVPGVIAMAKGRGMVPVKGVITENSLVQGFVAASNAGDCGPSAAAGCCP